MAPLILALKNEPWADVTTVATAQHREMLDQVLRFFNIYPELDLDLMRPDQGLADLTARLLQALDRTLATVRPHAVLVQGDTTTAMAASLASFYRQTPVGHVEAGLRSGDSANPFPEEVNRVIASKLARWHFAPTQFARGNLLREGVADQHVMVTGNTVIDALLVTAAKEMPLEMEVEPNTRVVLVTVHRRENFGAPFLEICSALHELAKRNPNVHFLYPVHPNPIVRTPAFEQLQACHNIHLCAPLEYSQFVAAMQRAYLIISDSGGVQEEAPALGKPVLVLREQTERPEALALGLVKLVGHSRERILREAQLLLDDRHAYDRMAGKASPYGDGQAAARIVEVLRRHFT